ncbi:MAG: hypothetical protein NVS1B11_12070 [Terriglobales bacterium]
MGGDVTEFDPLQYIDPGDGPPVPTIQKDIDSETYELPTLGLKPTVSRSEKPVQPNSDSALS